MHTELIPGPGIVTGKPYVKPRDAATLMILRKDGNSYKILMGKRSDNHTFMPGKYVFPGGRVDLADTRIKPASDFSAAVARQLLRRTDARATPGRARGLGLAAIRETFEETGIVIGRKTANPPKSKHKEWAQFYSTGYQPVLKPLRLLARAITPPGRPRRFDARFFVLDATGMDLSVNHPEGPTDELLEINWLTLAQTRKQDLPYITGIILSELEDRLALSDPWTQKRPVPFFYMAHNRFYRDIL